MQKQLILGTSNVPQFNLATEEYLLKHTDGEYVLLWVNSPAVIIGCNQNALEEVNLDYVKNNGVEVVRRISGGGAVYHDYGNVCYTIITSRTEEDSYEYFSRGVIGYLSQLGVRAEFTGRNDISVDGKKISGNAQCVHRNRIMHHGTILFNSDMEAVQNALKPNKLKMQSKGVKSVRKRVINVCEVLPSPISVEEFIKGLAEYFSKTAALATLTDGQIEQIDRLAKDKYSSFEWNYGYSPVASAKAEMRFNYGTVQASFRVEDGKLQDVVFTGDFFSQKEISGLNHALNGVLYAEKSVLDGLENVGEYIVGATADDIARLFFK